MFCSHCIFDHLAYLGNPCQLSNVGVVVVGVVVSCCCFFLLLFLLCYDHLRATGWSPQNTFLTKNQHFGYHQNHLKVFTCLDSCSCVFMWIIIEIFAKRSRSPGSSDMEKSLQSCCGPFRELEKLSKCIKLGKTHTLLQKNSIFLLFFFDLFLFLHFSSIDFVFVFDSCRFFPFSNQI